MAHTKKTGNLRRKVILKELTFMDVRESARDGQKVFESFVITAKLPLNLNTPFIRTKKGAPVGVMPLS